MTRRPTNPMPEIPDMRPLLLAVLAFTLISAMPRRALAQPAPLPSVELPAELDRVLRDYERAWKAGDAPALARIFTADGFVPGDAGWQRGSAMIEQQYARAGGDLRLRALAFETSGTVGYIIGAYRFGDVERDNGKFVLALRRAEDGRWLIVADLDRSNRNDDG